METENGVERIGRPELGEKTAVENRVVGDNMNKVDDIVERLKDVDDEAIDSQEKLQKQGANIHDSVSKLHVNLVNESDNFDIGIPTVGAEEVGGVVAEEEVNNLVDEGGTVKEVNGQKEVDGDEGIEILKDAVELNSGHRAEFTSDSEGEGFSENPSESDSEDEDIDRPCLFDTYMVDHLLHCEGEAMPRSMCKLAVIELVYDLKKCMLRELAKNPSKIGNGKEKYKKRFEDLDAGVERLHALWRAEVEDVTKNRQKKFEDIQCVQTENLEVDDMRVLDNANGVDESEEEQENSKSLDEDDSNGDAKKASVLLDSIHQGESQELISSSAAVHSVEKIDLPQILNSQSETIVNHSNEEPVTHEAIITLEDNKVAKAENDKVSEPLHADQLVNGVGKDHIVIGEHKKEAEEVNKEKHNQGNGERIISPSVKLVSSSEMSTGPAPSPVRPAGLGGAAPLLEPAPRPVQQQHRVNEAMSNVHSQQIDEPETDEYDETSEKLKISKSQGFGANGFMDTESGVETIGRPELGVKTAVENQVVGDNMNKVDDIVERLKDVEDEAIDSQENLQKQGANIHDSVSKLHVNLVNESDNFDIAIPTVGAEKVGGVVDEEEVNSLVDEGGTGKEVNGQKEVDGDEGIEILKDAVELNSGHRAEFTSDSEGEGFSENPSESDSEDEDIDRPCLFDTYMVDHLLHCEGEVLPKSLCKLAVIELVYDIKKCMLRELAKNPSKFGNGKEKYKKRFEDLDAGVERLHALWRAEVEDVTKNRQKKFEDIQCAQTENLEVDDMRVLDNANGVDESEEEQENSKSLDEDDSNGDAKKASVLLDSIHQGESEELISSSADVHSEERIDLPQILNSQSETIVNHSNEEPVT
ncbi:uncharacterized protein LOC126660179 [Mercurialis annua]|uniref:uncharacterized protein LOC126660179 n=1 Tax=Mercurialis annua TaxID=3986 RepID=UPI00215ED8E2|nr:uncharacterized protein LOC126660179 [Mercurialis annua]